MPSNILETLRSNLRREMNEIADHVATGGCLATGDPQTVAMEYAKQCGKIEGLAMAERDLLEILEQGKSEEEQDI